MARSKREKAPASAKKRSPKNAVEPGRTAAKTSRAEPARRGASERAVDAALVDETLGLLVAAESAAASARRRIGEHLLDRYFGGDEALARRRSPRKPKSYAMLERKAEELTDWDAADFRQAVLTAIVYRGLPAALRGRLPASSLYRLAAIEDGATRIALAGRIAAGELQGDALVSAVAEANAPERGGGRPAMPGPVRFGRRIERTLQDGDESGVLSRSAFGRLDADAREDLAERLESSGRRLLELARFLRQP